MLLGFDADHSIDEAIENRIARVSKDPSSGEDESFFVADLGQVHRQHQRWMQNLPSVTPFYAVKCNPDPVLLELLRDMGAGFDCASTEELRSVLNLGVDPSRMAFANPCKSSSSLIFASRAGILKTTFDNLDELDTIKTFLPNAQLFLRIFANDDSALISLGDKFGAPIEFVQPLLERASELGLNVVGISFHIGTGATDPEALVTAIQHAKTAFTIAKTSGFHLTTLDIGGGFQDSNFEMMAETVRKTIDLEFPNGVRTIAEPGRFYARSSFTLVSRVISRRRRIGSFIGKQPDMLYQNDGVFGNFMNALVEKEIMVPSLIRTLPNAGEDLKADSREHTYSIWGPTCDSTDCVAREARFDSEVKIGDWLKYSNMGAYTNSTSTCFNGFSNKHDVVYVFSEPLLRRGCC